MSIVSSSKGEIYENALILSSSPRKGGNTDMLCDAFAKGAKESGDKLNDAE
jgi:multimeric flavodoxin WrbA